jgi:hypothetical protein
MIFIETYFHISFKHKDFATVSTLHFCKINDEHLFIQISTTSRNTTVTVHR